MSPSEHDLRSALRRDEGEPLDVDRVTGVAAAARAARRTRLITVAASVVLVAAAAVTGTALLTRDDTPSSSAAGEQRSTASSSRQSVAGEAPAAMPSAAADGASVPRSTATPNCPTSFPRRMLPGGGSPGQFGADSPLFERTPTTITVCAYSGTGTVAGTTTVTGRDATALRVSLESASATPAPCPTTPGHTGRQLAFVGMDAQGRALRVVTTEVTPTSCNARTTNGTAVRYGWTPPASLADRLSVLGASVLPRITPRGKNIGSPVR